MKTDKSNIKVAKFGGSSLADAKHFKMVKDIITSDKARRFIVPSAPGKRSDNDDKVTDMLYHCQEKAAAHEDFHDIFAKIIERFESIRIELNIKAKLSEEYENIYNKIQKGVGRDYTASRGEYLCGKLLSGYLGFDFIDPVEYIKFGNDGIFDSEISNKLLSCELNKHENCVIPGFYGSDSSGNIRTFPRGGSDITGSITARAINADIYENWTDVDGILTADPKIIPYARTISSLTYRELRELSYMGANVLHEDTTLPIRLAGIPINLRNTANPNGFGTMIVSTLPDGEGETIAGISGKSGLITLCIEAESNQLRQVYDKLKLIDSEHVDIFSGIRKICLVFDSCNQRNDFIDNIRTDLPEHVISTEKTAMISIVGRGDVLSADTSSKILHTLHRNGINIIFADCISLKHIITIGINSNEFDRAIRLIYTELFG